jgi:hypothetical protein
MSKAMIQNYQVCVPPDIVRDASAMSSMCLWLRRVAQVVTQFRHFLA